MSQHLVNFNDALGMGGDVHNMGRFKATLDPNVLRPVADSVQFNEYVQAKFSADGMTDAEVVQFADMPYSLPEEAYVQWDRTIRSNYMSSIRILQDIIGAGLVYSLGNRPLGKTELKWRTKSDAGEAEASMSGVMKGQESSQEYIEYSMKLPIFLEDVSVQRRELESSILFGDPIDDSLIAEATRNVVRKAEDTFMNGTSVVGSNVEVDGLRTVPGINLSSSATDNDFTDPANLEGPKVVELYTKIMQEFADRSIDGPFVFYVNNLDHLGYQNDYVANYPKTIAGRIAEIDGIQAIRPSAHIPRNEIIAIRMNQDTLDLVFGFGPTLLRWGEANPMQDRYRVMAMMLPRFRTDHNSRIGILNWKHT